jgi:cell division protein FtsI (penicillin-binding protein 3)
MPMMSIGYEVKLAPIHILTFYNAIANDGKMVKPHFVKMVLSHGKVVKNFGTEVIQSSICSGSTLRKLKHMLEGVVECGTASNLKNATYKIAGKTGTAQIAKQHEGYQKQGLSYQASFVGYFPAENPKYSCIVVVNAPSNDVYYGNLVAGPVFKEISDKVFATSMNIQEVISTPKVSVDLPFTKAGLKSDLNYVLNKLDIPMDENQVNSDWVSTIKKGNGLVLSKRSVIKNLVPNVVDMGLRDALYLLENSGLKVIVKGCGRVVSQTIPPGTSVHPGETIILEMSLG